MILDVLFKSSNSFSGIHDDEKVVMLVRKHWFVPVSLLATYALFVLAMFVALVVGSIYITTHNLWGVAIFLFSMITMIVWYGAFYALTMYSLNTWILTNHRIINNSQNGFFVNATSEVYFSRIQDVSISVSGPIATFFKFGTIEVQSAGTEEKFTFEQIPDPEKIKETIMHMAGTYIPPHGVNT